MGFIQNVRKGLADMLWPRPSADADALQGDYFRAISAYTPVYTTFEGGIYEMELTRAAIHTFAKHCSKLKPEVLGSGNSALRRILPYKPNPTQTTPQFLYRLATILMVNNNAFIAPIMTGDDVTGYYPVLPSSVELREAGGQLYVVFRLPSGEVRTFEHGRVGIITRHQFQDDFFGQSNSAMRPTLDLMHTQNEAIINGVRSSGAVRLLAIMAQTLKDKTLAEERQSFVEANLSTANDGLMIIDQKYKEVKQLESKPLWVDDKQLAQIRDNVYNYFGTNADILQNKYNEDVYGAYYEGEIEPFALNVGMSMTSMTFSEREIAYGNEIMFSSNRLQYASNRTKLAVSSQMLDRGIMNRNEIREIWQLPSLGEEGEEYYIRGEYLSQSDRPHGRPKEGEENADEA